MAADVIPHHHLIFKDLMNLAGRLQDIRSPPLLSVEDAPFSCTVDSTEHEVFISAALDVETTAAQGPHGRGGGAFSGNISTEGGEEPDGDNGSYVLIEKA